MIYSQSYEFTEVGRVIWGPLLSETHMEKTGNTIAILKKLVEVPSTGAYIHAL